MLGERMEQGAPPTLLGLDTSTEACSVALLAEGSVIAQRFEHRERGHAERLVPMVLEVMREAGRGFESLDAIAVTIGPGSFTGVRVGLAAARGFALASGRPLIGLGTLDVLATAVPPAERDGRAVLAVLTALPGHVYAQAFEGDLSPLCDPLACDLFEAIDLLGGRAARVVGSGTEAVLGAAATRAAGLTAATASPWPHASALVARAAMLIGQSSIETLARQAVTPLYLKSPGIGASVAPSPVGA